MDWCVAQELIGAKPVSVATRLLPKQASARERVKHQPVMPWREVPKFVEDVLRKGNPNLSKSMLEFLILTAARSGEVRGMTWSEVDSATAVWSIPADRMKAKTAHRVPLSDRAVEILKEQKKKSEHSELIFLPIRGKVPSDMILSKFLRDHKVQSSEPERTATAQGFRSSFRDWASENGFARDLAKRALAHFIKNKVEAAYHRSDLLEQRRGMMELWAQHACEIEMASDKVVSILAKNIKNIFSSNLVFLKDYSHKHVLESTCKLHPLDGVILDATY
jgi:integrase